VLVIRREEIIHRPVEEVFNFAATNFFENTSRWPSESSFEKTSEGPIGLGTTARALTKHTQGREVESTFIITEYEPNRKLVMRSTNIYVRTTDGKFGTEKAKSPPSTEMEGSLTLEPVTTNTTKVEFAYKVWYQGVSRFYGPFMLSADAGFRRAIHERIDRMMNTLEGPSRERDLRGLLRRVPYGWIAYALAFIALVWMHSARSELGLTADSLGILRAVLTGMIMLVVVWGWMTLGQR